MRFPPNGFAVSLTLFSKCFSPFPHGNCSLSVSCRYLALDGVYHPLWAAIPNNPTRRAPARVHSLPGRPYGIVTLCDAPFQVNFGRGKRARTAGVSRPQFADPAAGDWKPELFPLRSPLLRESWLIFSLPPLIDMCKFSRSSRSS